MIRDDYGFAFCPGAKRAIAAITSCLVADRPENVPALTSGQSVVFKQ